MNYKQIGFGLGAFAAGAVAWTAGAAAFGPRPGSRRTAANDGETGTVAPSSRSAEHVPTDLMGDTHPGNDARAVEAFRPDPTAVPTDAEKEALRPATGPAPSFAADRGSSLDDTAGAA